LFWVGGISVAAVTAADKKQKRGGLKADLSGVKQKQINSGSSAQTGSSVTTDFMCGHWLFCGSWLACDADNSVYLEKHSPNVGASKPTHF